MNAPPPLLPLPYYKVELFDEEGYPAGSSGRTFEEAARALKWISLHVNSVVGTKNSIRITKLNTSNEPHCTVIFQWMNRSIKK